MPNYKNGKIYRIVCNETGEQYIGSTTVSLSRRLANHVYDTKRNNSCKSSSIIERGNYEIVLIEECPCENKEQLHARERHFIETTACVNTLIPLRTRKEYYTDNREKVNKWHKEYRKNNLHVSEYLKQYRELNKEKYAVYNKEYHKTNKEQINHRKKELYALKKQQTPEI